MRVLLEDEDGMSVIVVVEMYYDERGLILVDYSGDVFIFPYIRSGDFRYFCITLYKEGMLDLSAYDYIMEDDVN